MKKEGRFCAHCDGWTLKGAQPADADKGLGLCKHWAETPQPKEWNEHFCVLFTEDKQNRSARIAFVERMQAAGAAPAPNGENDGND